MTYPTTKTSFSSLPVVVAALSCVLASVACAQLSPQREYYGINRTIPMDVAMPEGVAGEVKIVLYSPGGDEVAVAAASEGAVDLAGLFPVLWTTTTPTMLYAQLLVDDKGIGSPVVLSPMVTPNLAIRTMKDNRPHAQFPDRSRQGAVYAGIRAWTDRHVVFNTSLGDIEFHMRPDKAPNTVANFIDLVEGGYYTDIIFHRIMGRSKFMAQVGDPTGTGSGGPGRFIDLEQSDLPHDFGVLSMARTGDPNTNGGQVFVCFSRDGTFFLDTQYCSFAQAVAGADTILALEAVETGAQDRPLDPPVLKSAKTVPAPPFGTGPEPLTRPETTGR
ncbi:MAG: peptidylprolyl isomerase [Planctomycetota bacterium]|nr:peptidylprolyl isomerase [Planctomycetota bacterium]